MTQMELWCWTGQWCHSLPTTAKIREGMGVGNGHSSSNNHWNQLSEANSFWDNVFDKKCSGTHPPGLFTPTGTTGTSKVNSRTFRPCCNHWTVVRAVNLPFVSHVILITVLMDVNLAMLIEPSNEPLVCRCSPTYS